MQTGGFDDTIRRTQGWVAQSDKQEREAKIVRRMAYCAICALF
jgi:hypothetical protein